MQRYSVLILSCLSVVYPSLSHSILYALAIGDAGPLANRFPRNEMSIESWCAVVELSGVDFYPSIARFSLCSLFYSITVPVL